MSPWFGNPGKHTRVRWHPNLHMRTVLNAHACGKAWNNASVSRGMWRARRDFELLTPRFVVWCSIQLSYGRF